MTFYESLKDLGFPEHEIESMLRTANLWESHCLERDIAASPEWGVQAEMNQRVKERLDVLYGRPLLTPDMITREATRILQNPFNLSREVNNDAAGLAPTLHTRNPSEAPIHPGSP